MVDTELRDDAIFKFMESFLGLSPDPVEPKLHNVEIMVPLVEVVGELPPCSVELGNIGPEAGELVRALGGRPTVGRLVPWSRRLSY